jgi:phosphatidate cytidylyltransferase
MQPSEHGKRLRAGFLLAFIGFSSLVLGGCFFPLLCAFLLWQATKEFVSLIKASGAKPLETFLLVLVPGCSICAAFSRNALNCWFTLSCIVILCAFVVRSFYGPKIKGTLPDLAASVFCLIYTGWLPAHIVLLRYIGQDASFWSAHPWKEAGIFYCSFALISVVINDTASYYAGKAFGRTKLAEAISPNKTIKGSVAGIACGTLTGILLGIFGAPYFGLHFSNWSIILLSFACNVLAQMGDLAESLMKRSVGAKDAGQTIEGHGGVLDRFDSHLLASNIAYYFFLAHYLNYF